MQISYSRIAAVAAALMITVGASCGSDSDSASSTAPTPTSDSTAATDTSAASTDASAASTDDSTAASTDPSAGGDDRETIVGFTVSSAADGGFELDPDCVSGIVDQLSDADVGLLADSLVEGAPQPELSAEGEALGETILDCIIGSDDQALIDQVIAKLLAEGDDNADEECLRTNVAKLNDEQLRLVLESETGSTGPESTDPQLQNAAFLLLDCVDLSTPDTTG